MADQTTECVILIESDDNDDDDIINIDEDGNPSEDDVIFVRRDRRRNSRNQSFQDTVLSENASNQPKKETAMGKGGSLEQPSNCGPGSQNINLQLGKLPDGNIMLNSLESPNYNLSPNDQLITDRKLFSRHLDASPGSSIGSTDVVARNSPSPLLDDRSSSMWSPTSPDASKNSMDIVGEKLQSQHPSWCSPVSNDSSLSSIASGSRDSSGIISPFPSSDDDFSLSLSMDSTDISTTHAGGCLTAEGTVNKNAKGCTDTICTNVLLMHTKNNCSDNTSKTVHTPAEQDCSCNVTQGMCQTCIANLDKKIESKNPAVISSETVSSHKTPGMSLTNEQTLLTTLIRQTDSTKLTLSNTSSGNAIDSSNSSQNVRGRSQKQTVSETQCSPVVIKQECTCDSVIASCHSCLTKLNKKQTTVNTGSYQMMPIVSSLSIGSCQHTTTGPDIGMSFSKRSSTDAILCTSKILSKKSRLLSCLSTSQPSTVLSLLDPLGDHSQCFSCGIQMMSGNLSQCLDAHSCCSQCLQQQAKSLLTKQSKGSLKCFHPGCDSFYPLSQLRKTLPAMVIEIVEEKLEQESIENATMFMMGQIEEVSGNEEGRDPCDKRERVDTWTLPPDWEPMDINGGMRTFELTQGSASYVDVALMFHNTMYAPRAEIVRIRRVQNPILWQFYSVKKRQMLQEIGVQELREMKLFHGTSNNVVDAICQSNFDWRLCGTHGTVFGQGSYFARDAKYAHMYTDGGKPMMRPAGLHNLFMNLSSSFAASYVQLSTPVVGLHVPSSVPAVSNMNASQGSVPGFANTTVTPQQPVRLRHTMFIARVLVGKYTIGYSALRKPPPLNPNDMYGKGYDSCVNDVNNPSIYVVFDNAQCYPEYIIEYTNVPGWAVAM